MGDVPVLLKYIIFFALAKKKWRKNTRTNVKEIP